jgi:hypothetical protein
MTAGTTLKGKEVENLGIICEKCKVSKWAGVFINLRKNLKRNTKKYTNHYLCFDCALRLGYLVPAFPFDMNVDKCKDEYESEPPRPAVSHGGKGGASPLTTQDGN